MDRSRDVAIFDRIARFYDLGSPSATVDDLVVGLESASRPIERLVDLGGGTGRIAAALDADSGVDIGESVVVDASSGMLARAADRGPTCVRGDARRIPLRDGSVDAVVVVDAFHHFPNQRRVARDVHRVLAPGGVFVVREFDPETIRGRVLVSFEHLLGFGSVFTGPDDFVRFLDDAGFDANVVERGFEYAVVGVKRESN